MSFHPGQFRELIVRPTLQDLGLWTPEAEELLMLTAAQESHLGRYLKQVGAGPALGIFQMEPATFEWLRNRWNLSWNLSDREAVEMIWDLRFATKMARLKYLSIKAPIPSANDIRGLAKYWDKYYNANPDAGFPDEAVRNYRKYVLEAL